MGSIGSILFIGYLGMIFGVVEHLNSLTQSKEHTTLHNFLMMVCSNFIPVLYFPFSNVFQSLSFLPQAPVLLQNMTTTFDTEYISKGGKLFGRTFLPNKTLFG